jgi:hypothetical protein
VPHFEVMTIGGEPFGYPTIWQRRALVLVVLRPTDGEASRLYVSEVMARRSEFTAKGTECVVTTGRVQGIEGPAVLVADRWGEIVHVATASQVDDLTSPQELLEWVDYLDRRCPECEGEAK